MIKRIKKNWSDIEYLYKHVFKPPTRKVYYVDISKVEIKTESCSEEFKKKILKDREDRKRD